MASGEISEKTRKAGIYACLIASFITTYSLMMVSVSMKDIRSSLGISFDQALWFIWSPLIATVGMCFISAAVANRYGKKTVLIIGLLLTIITSLISFFSNEYVVVLILRVIQGGGMSFLYVSMVSIMTDLATSDENGRVMGLNNIFSQIGTVGAVLGGYLITSYVGWHYIGLILIPFSLISIYLVRGIPNVTNPGRKPHFLQQTLFSATMLCLLFGLGFLGTMESNILIVATVVFFATFLWTQRKKENWILNYRLFLDNIPFRIALVSGVSMYIVTYNTSQLVGSFMQVFEKPYMVEVAVVLSLMNPLLQIVVTWVITHRFSGLSEMRKIFFGLVFALLAALMLLPIPFLDDLGDIVVCIISLLFVSMASGFFIAPNTSLMMSCVDPADRNDASSVNNFVRQFNKINGSLLVVILLSAAEAENKGPVFKTAMFDLSILFIFAVVLGGLLLYMYMKTDKVRI